MRQETIETGIHKEETMTRADHGLPSDAQLVELAQKAGNEILKIYESDFEVVEKADDSPLTKADLAAHEVPVSYTHLTLPTKA